MTEAGQASVAIVTGPPGAGKTVLGQNLSRALGLPFISKDDIKEILFETLGWEDRRWSMMLGGASFEILFHSLERHFEAGRSALVETAFVPEYHTVRFSELLDRYDFRPVQILCTADERILFERFVRRIASGERHPGHVDHLMSYHAFVELLRSRGYGPLQIGGLLLEIDTSDFEAINFEKVVQTVRTSI